MRGFLLVDKPQGITSHGVVAQIRRTLNIKKVGHAGTLDPMATGLLVVAVGPVTRLIRWVQDAEKEYSTTVSLGVGTTTLDAEGEIIERVDMSSISRLDVEAVLEQFRGQISQIPPMVSALKVDGKRLHALAREGIEVEREPRTVTIKELELTSFEAGPEAVVGLRVVCSKGTYIRTLGDDIGISVGGRGHLTSLRRTRIGALFVGEALDLDSVRADRLIDPAEALASMTAWEADAEMEQLVGYGRPLERPAGCPVGTELRVMSQTGRMLAVYVVEEERMRPEVVLG
jgi:tRNA pseudouridine55 synthase